MAGDVEVASSGTPCTALASSRNATEPAAKRHRAGDRPLWQYDPKENIWDATPWVKSVRPTAHANELRDIHPMKAGDPGAGNFALVQKAEMLIYPLRTYLHEGESDNTWLFIRKHAKQVWDEVLRHNFKRSAVIGSPGIGKSFSSAYLLKRLLENTQLVVYEARRQGQVYVFVPPGLDGDNADYVVYTASLEDWRPRFCSALTVPDTYYLIDPDKPENSRPIAIVVARTVVFPSPEPQHLSEWKKAYAELFYMGAWMQEEVLAIRQYMRVDGKELDDATVEESFWRFGGILRHVYASTAKQSDFYGKATSVLEDDALVQRVYEKATEGLGTKDRDKPPSALFMLVPVEDIFAAGPIFQRKPDSFRPFAEARIAIISEWGRHALVKQYWGNLEKAVSTRTGQTAVLVGWQFEEAAHLTLAQGGTYERRYLSSKRKDDELVLPSRTLRMVRGSLQNCLCEVLKAESQNLYVQPENPKMPVMDAAEGQTCELYQITINMYHVLADASLRKAVDLLAAGGKNLVLNWVVPERLFNNFEAKALPSDLASKVEQRVLKLRPKLPASKYE